jgi:hypothetical protein
MQMIKRNETSYLRGKTIACGA